MYVAPAVWTVTVAVVVLAFVAEFFLHVRKPHTPTFKESGLWSLFYIALAVIFGGVVSLFWSATYGGEFLAGYVTEKALSVDNLFVFVIIFASFAIPRQYQQKVLMLGIVIALILRAVFIGFGAAAINAWAWVFYIFGAILIYTAVKLIRDAGHDETTESKEDSRITQLVKRFLPTTDEFDGNKLLTRVSGKRVITPLMIALIVVGFSDVLFALDSIPAIYGLTQQPYLVFTANVFALMGLRQLFFLLDGLLDRLVYLSYGLSVILAFIGVKLILHALHENNLRFINAGNHVAVPEISTGISLGVIIGVLVVTSIASLLKTRRAAISAGATEQSSTPPR